MGGRYQKENYVLLMNVIKKEEDQTVMECAYHIRQSSSCYLEAL